MTGIPVAQPRSTDRARTSHIFARLFIGLLMVYLFAPAVVTVLFSITTSPRLNLPIEGLTLDWYGAVFSNPLFTDALLHSLELAVFAALAAGVLGTLFAFGVMKLGQRNRRILLTASLVPAAAPVLILGIALALFFSAIKVPQGLATAAVGHVLICLPFVILTMNARLETFDFSMLEAARDLGASPARTFRDVTLPLIRPSVLGASLLAMALSLDSFVVTWFTVGNQQTLPTLIWGLMRRGIDPSVNAVATVILVFLVGLVVLSNLIDRRTA